MVVVVSAWPGGHSQESQCGTRPGLVDREVVLMQWQSQGPDAGKALVVRAAFHWQTLVGFGLGQDS